MAEFGKDMRTVKTAEERKNEILDVAEELFAEKGYDNASTNDIIARIGIARGTLYHHFGSKEEILDAIVDRMTREGISQARSIVNDKSLPSLKRLTGVLGSLQVKGSAGNEVMEQMHKPQNALLHQKMQERLINGVVPLIAQLIKEGNESGIFDTKYPNEAAEMIMLYGNIAFDDNENLTPRQKKRKGNAFIYNIEKMLGAKAGSLEKALMRFF
ncbi:TetR/AcrR family transcriptional regulator [Butyrivibrio sp. YAB3001]|uniref:TetR/AcrR family transcriptional regulator n=1 Tax=Butyrivibrio sp. YAB3001 TaxID=1520812 RepID=UPI0008F632D1|nr:TetR/AcrR family transcriptional regulator [Butyrivibrio sp. YAB3001]SFC49941.1 transcriptional regulator, TetR family [Butyrivibrio sp. YAB3001]